VAIDDSTLARRVRDALTYAKITQIDLARTIGMDDTALSKCLSRKRKISSLELAKIADAVGVSVSALLADRDSPMSFSGRVDVARVPATEATEFLQTLIDLDELLVDRSEPVNSVGTWARHNASTHSNPYSEATVHL
jgi:transcriptional regulator with XRE-family HTH domain